MSKEPNNIKFKRLILIFVVLYLMLTLLIFPERSISSAKNALLLCANVLIPSLFSFFVFSSVLTGLGFADFISRPMSKFMHPLFNVSGKGALCLVLGIISGYPLGAVCVCDMYKNGDLSKDEAQRLIAFCNNSGPLFVIGCVGVSMYQSQQIGFVLYIIHVLSSLFVGIILGRFRCFNRKNIASHTNTICIHTSKPLGVILKESVTNSVNNILLVCGFTIVFAVIMSSIEPFLYGEIAPLILGGFLEISQGTKNIAASSVPLNLKLILTSAIISFGGFSVHLQASGIVSKTDLSTKTYFIGKILQSVIASLLTMFVFRNTYIPTYAQYIYPVRPYEIINFTSALKLSFLYLVSAILVMLIFWALERLFLWQKKIKHKR